VNETMGGRTWLPYPHLRTMASRPATCKIPFRSMTCSPICSNFVVLGRWIPIPRPIHVARRCRWFSPRP